MKPLSTTMRNVLDVLRDADHPLTPDGISARGIGGTAVINTLKALEDRGLVSRSDLSHELYGCRTWTLTEDGIIEAGQSRMIGLITNPINGYLG